MQEEKYKYKTEPYEHQRKALIKGANAEVFAYFMEMGTGKTKVSIDNACWLYSKDKIDYVVVVAPNSVYQNWEKELEIHCSVPFQVRMHKVDKKFFDIQAEKNLKWYLINVEAFSRGEGTKIVNSILANYGHRCLMLIDESTTIKNRQAKRTKTICKVGKLAKYRRILTGSPITKSPLDLYTQCEFLSPTLLGFRSFFAFKQRYCHLHQINLGANKYTLVPLYYINLDELESKIKSFSYRVKKDDCLDLPLKTYQQRFIDFSPKQKAIYNQAKQEAYVILNNTEVSFANKLTEILKLHQICNGFLIMNDGSIQTIDDCPKIKELFDIIEETDGKFIIWANYVHNIETITKLLKSKYGFNSTVCIYGDVNVTDRTTAVKLFQENSECRFFVGNPMTGGYGLTLTAASYVVYFSNNYNLEIRQQSEDRAHRIGQNKNVTYIDIIMKNSIDIMIISALQRKIRISAETLGEELKSWI